MAEDLKITRAAELITAHQTRQAAYLLSRFLQKNPLSPESIPAWMLLTQVVDSPDQQIDCLLRVLRIDPRNKRALEMLRQLVSQQAAVPGPAPVKEGKPGIATGFVPPFPEESISSSVELTGEPILKNQPAFVLDEVESPSVTEIPPEIINVVDQVKSLGEYFEDVKTVTRKFRGNSGPDYQNLQTVIAQWISAGYMLQVEEHPPRKLFRKPEIKLTFAKPKAVFQGYCHDYPYVFSRYNAQKNLLGYNVETITGQHKAYVGRSLEERKAGLELLRIITPDRKQSGYQAVIREKNEEFLFIDLFQGNRSRKIGEILRDSRQQSEVVNDAGGKPVLRLVDRSLKELKWAVYTIQKDTSLLRYQTRAFDFFTHDMLCRIGDPHRLSDDEEALILLTGLLAVDYLI